MDKKEIIRLLAGTITRGIMWGAAFLGGKIGTEAMDENTMAGLATWLASAVVAIVALFWSKKKDTKLTWADPKGWGDENQKLRKYSRFLHSCAASGEEPKSYEWFCAENEPR